MTSTLDVITRKIYRQFFLDGGALESMERSVRTLRCPLTASMSSVNSTIPEELRCGGLSYVLREASAVFAV